MSRLESQDPHKVIIRGRELKCPVCNNDLFRSKRVLLNTTMATFFGLDWANRNAICHVCTECGNIQWFNE
ncbi:MAG: hypothetical protein U0X39_11720 [Bacteroidales bacterium]